MAATGPREARYSPNICQAIDTTASARNVPEIGLVTNPVQSSPIRLQEGVDVHCVAVPGDYHEIDTLEDYDLANKDWARFAEV